MTMRFRVFESPQEAGVYVASITEGIVTQQEKPVLGLATGSTPIPYYTALTRLYECGLDLSSVVTFNLDEYVGLSSDQAQSYSYFMNKYLFSKVNISPANRHLPNGVANDLIEECRRYDSLLTRFPRSLQILGIGRNGHIGFNEPDESFQSSTHIVHLEDETIRSNARFFTIIQDVPRLAITMGIKSIMEASKIVLLAFGSEKADIVCKAFTQPIRADVPASILQLHHDVTIVLDKFSASKISYGRFKNSPVCGIRDTP